MKSLRLKLLPILLGLVVLVGGSFRFFDLGKIPGSLDWDEASIGYNAYSILTTGKDEYGKNFPLSFKAFGEYKQPVYIYAAIPSIKIFGLNQFAVRFPSALFGTLSIILVYFLVIQLFSKNPNRQALGLLSAAFFAISPWSIQFSRIAFETNIALFFVILGAFLFLKGISKKENLLLFLSIIFFTLSLYAYISEKLFIPIILIVLFIYAFKKIPTKKIILLLLLFIGLNLPWLLSSESITRGRGVLITYNSQQILDETFAKRQNLDISNPLNRLTTSPKFLYTKLIINNYFSHLDPEFLFFKGDNPRHHAPGFGVLYLFELPFILVGALVLLRKKNWSSVFLFSWFLTAPIASSLVIDAPSASRAELFLPIWQIFSALGIFESYLFLKKKHRLLPYGFFLVLIVIAIFSIAKFTNQYFGKTNLLVQKDWQYGYQEAVKLSISEKSVKTVFDETFEQPYIFYLFYSKYPPMKYIDSGGSERREKECFAIDNALFGKCYQKLNSGDLYLSTLPSSLPNLIELKKVSYVNGNPAVIMYRVK